MNRAMPLQCGKGGTFQVRFFFYWRGSVSEELRTERLTVWGGMGVIVLVISLVVLPGSHSGTYIYETLLGVERGKWKMDHKK